jgi:hypothetical protein
MMTIAQVQKLIQYVTNAQGDRTGVLVPLEVWEQLIESWQALQNARVDDEEPKENILADLQESIRLARAGQTFPLSQLWDDIDE